MLRHFVSVIRGVELNFVDELKTFERRPTHKAVTSCVVLVEVLVLIFVPC